MSSGADIDAADDSGCRALHKAAMGRDIAVVQLLLDRGANVGAVSVDGWATIHLAAHVESGPTEILNLRSCLTGVPG